MWSDDFLNLFFLTTNMHTCSLIPIEELSVGQIGVLRKLCLVKLTALIELHKAKSNVYVITYHHITLPPHIPSHIHHHTPTTHTTTHTITHTPSHSHHTYHHTYTITLQLHTPSRSTPLWLHVLITLPICPSLVPGYWREESQNCPTAKVSSLIQCWSLSNLLANGNFVCVILCGIIVIQIEITKNLTFHESNWLTSKFSHIFEQPNWQVTGLIPRSPYMEWDIAWEWG